MFEVLVLARSFYDPNPEAFDVIEVLRKGARSSGRARTLINHPIIYDRDTTYVRVGGR